MVIIILKNALFKFPNVQWAGSSLRNRHQLRALHEELCSLQQQAFAKELRVRVLKTP